VIVNVSVELSLIKIDEGVNDLKMTGGALTVSEETPYPLEAVLVPLSVAEIFPVVLVYCPAVLPKISTEKLQEEFAARVAPLIWIEELPASAVIVCPETEPDVQVGTDKPLGVLTNSPEGKESLNATPVNELELKFLKVKVSVETPPSGTDETEKLLVSVGGLGCAQPVITTWSRYTAGVAPPPDFAPQKLRRNFDCVELDVTPEM
jgi:hypothetical protein